MRCIQGQTRRMETFFRPTGALRPVRPTCGGGDGVCRRERLDPEQVQRRWPPNEGDIYSRLKREIGLKKQGRWSLGCVTGQLTCRQVLLLNPSERPARWLQGDRREPADGRRAS
jgi:hypothetical protein